jgi:biopolymer transport protein ExbB/TolQ
VSLVNVEYSRIDAVERRMNRTAAEMDLAMKRGLIGLASIAVTAPFVGSVGMCIGIATSFKGISSGDESKFWAALVEAISEALIPTALGLLVAIPSCWAFRYFTARMESLKVEMKNGSSELLDYLSHGPELQA